MGTGNKQVPRQRKELSIIHEGGLIVQSDILLFLFVCLNLCRGQSKRKLVVHHRVRKKFLSQEGYIYSVVLNEEGSTEKVNFIAPAVCPPKLVQIHFPHTLSYFTITTLPGGCCCSVAKLCLTLCNPINCSTPGFPVLHYLQEFAQTHFH